MEIRALEPGDREAWQQMFSDYAAFYKTALPEGGHDRVWNWIFDEDTDYWCTLAVGDDGEPIGFTQYQLIPDSLNAAMLCYMGDLYVCPESRGAGAGRALIDHVIAFAKARGIKDVTWMTQEFNYTARRLYDTYRPRSEFILYTVSV